MSDTTDEMLNSALDSYQSRGTTLQQFLSKFSSSEGKFVNTVNPLATFDAKILFSPHAIDNTVDTRTAMDKIGSALKSAASNALNNLANNATGGLLASLLNKDADVMKTHDNFQHIGKHSFLEMLAEANMIVGGKTLLETDAITSPLEISLGYYVQSATIPKIKMADGGKSTTLLGEFPLNGSFVVPDNNQLQLEVLCTKLPLHERLFYPWLKEVSMPYWSYDVQPYTTAKITIDFSKHTDIQYVFYGCRPCSIDTIQPTQQPDATLTRQVAFIFDYMGITSKKLPVMESALEKLLSTGKQLVNGATTMMNLGVN